MKKQLHVFVNDDRKLIVDVEGRFVSAGVFFQPESYESRDGKAIVSARGMEKKDDNFVNLKWPRFEIQEGQTLLIKYGESEDNASELSSYERLNEVEPTCTFCDRKASEVKTLIERNDVARICEDCVNDCVTAIRSRQPDSQ